MPADGSWPPFSPVSESRHAVGVVRLLELLDRQVADGRRLSREQAVELAAALQALEARIAATDARPSRQIAHAPTAEGARAALGPDTDIRIAPSEPWPVRVLLASAAGAAMLAVVSAAVVVAVRPDLAPAFVAPMDHVAHAVQRAVEGRDAALPRPRLGPASPRQPSEEGEHETYAAVSDALVRGDVMGVARLTALARAGDSQAQLHLAGFYESGQGGLPQDLRAARNWTERAAKSGDRLAMHNLGLFLMEGEGGPRDLEQAALWFRRAAERGVVDSQYNLGLLYEAGRGVSRNVREAYRWFAIAANAGDLPSREKQVELEVRLPFAERAGLDQAAAQFRPGEPSLSPDSVVIPPAATVAETQALLARRGYYVGPLDGRPSADLRAAAAAFLKDNPGAAGDS